MNPRLILILFSFSIIVLSMSLFDTSAFAHKDGCHSKHSCPSDSGSYECGDKGYCSQCPDNKYCKAGQPINQYSKSYGSSSTKSKLITDCKGTFDSITKRIVDGDTLYVESCKNSIRLSLVDTPEKNEIGFHEAKSFTQNLCKIGSKVKVDQDDKQTKGSYGRLVAKVFCNGINLNEALLENGHAVISKQYCKKSEFASESWAKKYGC